MHQRRQHIRPGDLQPVQRHRPMSSHRLGNRPRMIQPQTMTGYDLVQVGSVQDEEEGRGSKVVL